MAKRQVNVELTDKLFHLRAEPKTTFSMADVIYFTNVLPGEHAADGNGFVFDKYVITPQIFEEIIRYLESERYSIQLNDVADIEWKRVGATNADMERSIETGRRLKSGKGRVRVTISGFLRKLKPFQVPAVTHMESVSHAANFSVPGSGKTTVALASYANLRNKGVVNKLVVIGPRSSFAPWETEFEACLGTSYVIERITGNPAERKRAWSRAEGANLVLMNYHTASNDRTRLSELLAVDSCMLLLDESHHIKNIKEGIWATAVKKAAPLATKRVIMTGTPTPNSILDIWSQFTFLYPTENVLGSKEQFMAGVLDDSDRTREQIRRKLSPLFWRTKKRDLDLPRPKVRRLYVRQGEVQQGIYSALSAKLLRDVAKAPSEINSLRKWRRARIIRLLQAASNPTLLARYSSEFKLPPLSATGLPVNELIDRYPDFEVPAKITKAVSLVDSLIKAGQKVVIWTSFVHNIHMLLKLLEPIKPLPLYGGIPLSEKEDAELNREMIIERFHSDPRAMVLVANPAACAESISLHKTCHNAIYLDRTFNCAHYLQSKDRIHRVGLKLTDEINYFLLIGRNSIDEVVDDRLNKKERAMLRLLEADFSTVDLELPEDAISEEGEENQDFLETLKHLTVTVENDYQS